MRLRGPTEVTKSAIFGRAGTACSVLNSPRSRQCRGAWRRGSSGRWLVHGTVHGAVHGAVHDALHLIVHNVLHLI